MLQIIQKIKDLLKEYEKSVGLLEHRLSSASAKDIRVIANDMRKNDERYLLQIRRYVSEGIQNAQIIQKDKDAQRIKEIKDNLANS